MFFPLLMNSLSVRPPLIGGGGGGATVGDYIQLTPSDATIQLSDEDANNLAIVGMNDPWPAFPVNRLDASLYGDVPAETISIVQPITDLNHFTIDVSVTGATGLLINAPNLAEFIATSSAISELPELPNSVGTVYANQCTSLSVIPVTAPTNLNSINFSDCGADAAVSAAMLHYAATAAAVMGGGTLSMPGNSSLSEEDCYGDFATLINAEWVLNIDAVLLVAPTNVEINYIDSTIQWSNTSNFPIDAWRLYRDNGSGLEPIATEMYASPYDISSLIGDSTIQPGDSLAIDATSAYGDASMSETIQYSP